MTFLLLNQTFHPDLAATAQYLSDLAVRLAERGHKVTVVTSRRAYNHPERLFPKFETWRGITIYRVWSTSLGKSSKWRRAADFASFLLSCALRLLCLRRHDAVVALTSPPLISFLAALFAKSRGSHLYYWVMDLNPDEAIAAGWLAPNSLAARVLEWLSRFSLRHATRIIALDHFMQKQLLNKDLPGTMSSNIRVIPPWSLDDQVAYDPAGRERFRKQHGLDRKFVVMYSGNHSPCHPLDTLLHAAELLSHKTNIVFCFVGGGTEWHKIRSQLADTHSPQIPSTFNSILELANAQPVGKLPASNLLCLPYQPLPELSGSLSAADLHVVVLGDPFVGLVHPCKIYNILAVRAPVLYVGPEQSHVTQLLASLDLEYRAGSFRHGDSNGIARFISTLSSLPLHPRHNSPRVRQFSKENLLPKLVAAIERPAPPDAR